MDIVAELVANDVLIAVAAAGAYVGLEAFARPWLQTAETTPSSSRCATHSASSYAYTPTMASATTTAMSTPTPTISMTTATTTTTKWFTHTTTKSLIKMVTPTSSVLSTATIAGSNGTKNLHSAHLTPNYNLDWIHRLLLVIVFILCGVLCTLLYRHGRQTNPLTSVNEDSSKWRDQAVTARQEKEETQRNLQQEHLEKTSAQRQLDFARITLQRLAQCDPYEVTGVDSNEALDKVLSAKEATRQRDEIQNADQRKTLEQLNADQAEKIRKLENELEHVQNSSAWWLSSFRKDQIIKDLEKASVEQGAIIERLQARVRACQNEHAQEDAADSLRSKIASLRVEKDDEFRKSKEEWKKEKNVLEEEIVTLKIERQTPHNRPDDPLIAFSQVNAKITKELEKANRLISTLQQQLHESQGTTSSDMNSRSDDFKQVCNDLQKATATTWGLQATVAEKDKTIVERDGYYQNLMNEGEKKFMGLKADNDAKAQQIVNLDNLAFSKTQETLKLEAAFKNVVANANSSDTEKFQAERNHLVAQIQDLQLQIEEKTKALAEFQQTANQVFNTYKSDWDNERTSLKQELSTLRQEQKALIQDAASKLEKALAEARNWEEYGDRQRKAKNEALDAKDQEISRLQATVGNTETDKNKVDDDLKAQLAEMKQEMKTMADKSVADAERIRIFSKEVVDLDHLSEGMRGFIRGVEMLLDQMQALLGSKSTFELGYDIEAMKANIKTALKRAYEYTEVLHEDEAWEGR